MDSVRCSGSNQFNKICSKEEILISVCVKWQEVLDVMWKDSD